MLALLTTARMGYHPISTWSKVNVRYLSAAGVMRMAWLAHNDKFRGGLRLIRGKAEQINDAILHSRMPRYTE
jgi:hypothetical protein